MTTPEEWNRTYSELSASDFVPLPGYDLEKLMVPLDELRNPRNIPEITRKLTYSTRYFGTYDIDKGEFTGSHAGIDLKLALGQPIGAIAGGKVHAVRTNDRLGLHVIIEHRHPTNGTFYSVYAHLGSTQVSAGDAVTPGQSIGTVGMTGHTSGPHVHLQVDRGEPGEQVHRPYQPTTKPSRGEAAKWSINPMEFILRYAAGA